MDPKLATEFLTSDSDEIAELKANLNLLEGFIGIAREINSLPDIKKRFYPGIYTGVCITIDQGFYQLPGEIVDSQAYITGIGKLECYIGCGVEGIGIVL